MADKTAPGRLVELDALRGIAAILVVLFHYTFQGDRVVPDLKLIPLGLSWGFHGVVLFFAISGFVIFMTLEKTSNALDFLISRFARLFPAYWSAIGLTTLVLTLFGLTSLTLSPAHTAMNLTMLQGFFYLPNVDGVYWSLATELAFYACMMALWRARALARIEAVLLGWIALKLLWWSVPWLPTLVGEVMIVRYIPWFAIGMVAYRVWSGARTWRQQAWVLLLGLFSATLIDGWGDFVVYSIVIAVFMALVSGRLTLLDQRFLLWLGAISYPLYLVHQYVGYAFIQQFERAGLDPWLSLACTLAAVLGISQVIHDLIEQPALTRIRRCWKRRAVIASGIADNPASQGHQQTGKSIGAEAD